mgnify:CR=1 FL=1
MNNQFTYKLIKTTKFQEVTFDLYTSNEGYFVEASNGLESEYMISKKEALGYIANAKRIMKLETTN